MSSSAAAELGLRPGAAGTVSLARLGAVLIPASAILMLSLFLFLKSPYHWVADSHYEMMLSEVMYRTGQVYLDDYFRPPLDPVVYPGLLPTGYPLHVERLNGHIFYFYPPGSSVLSIPFVALENARGVSALTPDGRYNIDGETTIQATLAALLMAAWTGILFATARMLLPTLWSAALALAAAFGTQIYSTASRAMWSHTWGVFLLGTAILILVADARRVRRMNQFILATIVMWAFFVRPTNAIIVAAVSCYVLFKTRRHCLPYVITCALWFAIFVVYSVHFFGKLLPTQYSQGYGFVVDLATNASTLAGLLVSPSRGLFVFSPLILVVVFWLVRFWRWLPQPGLAWLALGAIGSQLVLISGWREWWGGFSYGPRLLTELVPWLALLAILALAALLSRPPTRRRAPLDWMGWGLSALLVGMSVFVNYRGATSADSIWWDVLPVSVNSDLGRLWDWRHPQFLAGLLPGNP